MDEVARREETERAQRARNLLENPIWIEAWTKYEEALKEHMTAPDSTDEAVLEARRGLIVLRRVRRHIERVIETGDMARIELERIQDGTADARH